MRNGQAPRLDITAHIIVKIPHNGLLQGTTAVRQARAVCAKTNMAVMGGDCAVLHGGWDSTVDQPWLGDMTEFRSLRATVHRQHCLPPPYPKPILKQPEVCVWQAKTIIYERDRGKRCHLSNRRLPLWSQTALFFQEDGDYTGAREAYSRARAVFTDRFGRNDPRARSAAASATAAHRKTTPPTPASGRSFNASSGR